MGESNLEHNTIDIFGTCVQATEDIDGCAELALEYAREKEDAIAGYFAKMQRIATETGDRLAASGYRLRSKAIHEAARRARETIRKILVVGSR